MKRKIVYILTLAAVFVGCFFVGKNSAKPEPWEYIDPSAVVDWNTDGEELAIFAHDGQEYYCYKSDNIYDSDYINLSQIADYTATESGLQLYFKDGTGYYFER